MCGRYTLTIDKSTIEKRFTLTTMRPGETALSHYDVSEATSESSTMT
jgi:putative SOS response-associated peptidase YedK